MTKSFGIIRERPSDVIEFSTSKNTSEYPVPDAKEIMTSKVSTTPGTALSV
jgi:hypothetical protein